MTDVQNINDSINYQKGAVVSKEIVKNDGGTVTLFAFDEGQGLSEHKAPFDALVIVTDGIALVNISGKEYKVQSGEMILMKANEPHALKAEVPFRMLLTMLKS